MSRKTTWTVLTVTREGKTHVTRDLTLDETLRIVSRMQDHFWMSSLPRSPWPGIAYQKALEITEIKSFDTAFEKAFEWLGSSSIGAGGLWHYNNYDVTHVEVWSNDGTELHDVWPEPENLVEMIVSSGSKIIQKRKELARQLLEWFDEHSNLPFANRPDFVFRPNPNSVETYRVKP